jgi:hypothetical protein
MSKMKPVKISAATKQEKETCPTRGTGVGVPRRRDVMKR